MPGLISDQLLRNLRVVANKQLVTPVKVYRMAKSEGPYGTVEAESLVLETVCWYKPAFKGDLGYEAGGLLVNASNAEFRFDIGDDVQVGDRLEVDGEKNFVVQDTSAGATIQLYLKAWTNRLEPSPDG